MNFNRVLSGLSSFRYPHACTIWTNDVQRNVDKTFNGFGWAIVAAGVPCRFQTGESVKAPSEFVLDEQDNLFTFDIVRFAADGDVPRMGDVLEMTDGPERGAFYIVRGDVKFRTQMANAAAVRCARTDDPPQGVS